jgi:hypothetical protein
VLTLSRLLSPSAARGAPDTVLGGEVLALSSSPSWLTREESAHLPVPWRAQRDGQAGGNGKGGLLRSGCNGREVCVVSLMKCTT